jgi:hypothetical protein
MKKVLVILVCCLFSSAAVAQKNFVKGYIVRQSGDTLLGFINYKERPLSPAFFEYKSSEGAIIENLSVREIQYAEITGGDRFQRFIVKITMDENDQTKINPSKTIQDPKTDTLFLRVLERGIVSLYAYQDEIKTRFFLRTGDSTPQELIYKVAMRSDGKFNHFYAFRNALANVAKHENKYDKKMERLVESSDYKVDPLSKIVRTINGFQNKKRTKSLNPPFSFYAGVGMMQAARHFKGDEILAEVESHSTINPVPIFFGGTDIYVKPDIGRLFFRAELSSFSLTEKTTAKNSVSLRDYFYTYNYKVSGVRVGLHFLYHFYLAPRIKIYGGPGIDFMHAFKTESITTELSYNRTSPDNYIVRTYPYYVYNNWVYLSAIIGVRIANKLDAKFVYMPPKTISSTYNSSSNLRALTISLSYTLKGQRKKLTAE